MKKTKIWSMMMLAVMALPMIVACGGDDNNDPPSYTEKEIVELLTGSWNVAGEYNLDDKSTSFLVGTYTGNMHFKSDQTFTRTITTTSTINKSDLDEKMIATFIEEEFIRNYHKYSILKSGGQSYVSFRSSGTTYKFAIKELSKNSFRLVCDQDVIDTTSDGKGEQVVGHVYMTIVSQ